MHADRSASDFYRAGGRFVSADDSRTNRSDLAEHGKRSKTAFERNCFIALVYEMHGGAEMC